MEIRVLRYFLAVAQEKSILGASEVLHISQPTLSRQLMDLEDELGKKLFIRGNRRITLTDEGMILRKRAEEIVGLVEKTESEITSSDVSVSGDVYIGGGETDGMRIVAQTAKRIVDEGYDIRFHLFSGNGTDVAERLDKGLIDFGLFVEGADLKKYDSIRLPVSDTWGVLMRRDNPLAAKKSVKARDLAGVPLFISKQAADTHELSGWLDDEEIKITGTYNLLYNASLMADEGVGCVLCLDKIINLSEESNLCFRPLSPKREARLDIVWKRYQVFSKASELFLDKLREICAE